MPLATERHRTERGIILHLLSADDAEWTAIRTLWRLMDRRGFPVSLDSLQFHLKYLLGRKYIAVKRVREMEDSGLLDTSSMSPDQILFVQMAPDGLGVINKSRHDSEVIV